MIALSHGSFFMGAIINFACFACLVLMMSATAGLPAGHAQAADPEHAEVVVRMSGEGEFVGGDERPILAALTRLEKSGGILLIETGRYTLHAPLRIPRGVTIRGGDEVVLALPPPTRTTELQSAGASTLLVASSASFRPDTEIQILPHEQSPTFADGQTASVRARITAIDGDRLHLAQPLPVDVPAHARIGYRHHAIQVNADHVTIEHLTIDGGSLAGVPMPGHAERCAVWAAAPYDYEKGPTAPPVKNLRVRHCTITRCYGRGVSMYNVVDSAVIGCRLEHIADEAINLDHFTFRTQAIGNDVHHAPFGVVLNDAGDCLVAHNRLINCHVGVHMFWWPKCGQYPGINRNNRVEHNVILGANPLSIRVRENVRASTIEFNYIDAPMEVVHPDNTVRWNTQLRKR